MTRLGTRDSDLERRRFLRFGLGSAALCLVAGLLAPAAFRQLNPQLAVTAAHHRNPDDPLRETGGGLSGAQPDPWGNPWAYCLKGGVLRSGITVVANPDGSIPRTKLVGPYSRGPNGVDEWTSGDDLEPGPLSVRVVFLGWSSDGLVALGVILAWLTLGSLWLRGRGFARSSAPWVRVVILTTPPLLLGPLPFLALAPAVDQLSLPLLVAPSQACLGAFAGGCLLLASFTEVLQARPVD